MRQWGLIISIWAVFCCACNTGPERPGTAKTDQGGTAEKPLLRSTDSAYINELLSKAYPLLQSNPDSAIILYQQALAFSKGKKYYSEVTTAYTNLAWCYAKKNAYDKQYKYNIEGIAYTKDAIKTSKARGSQHELRKLYPALANFYTVINDYDSVITIRFLSRRLYNLEDSLQRIQYLKLHYIIAGAYFKTGAYDSATNLYLSLLPYLEPPDTATYSILGYTYMGLGSVFACLSNEKKVISYYQKAEQLAYTFRDTGLRIDVLSNRGNYYMEHLQFKNAISQARQAIALIHQQSNSFTRGNDLFRNTYAIAASLMQDSQAQAALPYSQSAFRYATESWSKENLALANYLLAGNYIRLRQPQKAIPLLHTAIELSNATGQEDRACNAYGQLGMAYSDAGNFREGYRYITRYITLREKLRGKESGQQIAEANSKYQVAEKDKVLAQQQLQIEREQQVKYLWIGGALFLIGALLVLLWRKQHKAALEKLRAKLAGEEQERSRMARELHDGIVSHLSLIKTNFSALPQYYRGDSEAEELQEVIRQLDQGIAELRNTSHNLMPEMLRRNGLVSAIDSYCENINKTGPLQVVFQVIGNLPLLNDSFQLNIYRIIQELLQNILKHSGASRALIQFNIRGELLEITVDDNGTEARPEPYPAQAGIGLQSLRDRIKLLEGDMELETGNGTSVYLHFDMKKHKLL